MRHHALLHVVRCAPRRTAILLCALALAVWARVGVSADSPQPIYLPLVSRAIPTPTATPTVTPTISPTTSATGTATISPTVSATGTATPLPGTEVTASDDFSDPRSNWPTGDRGAYAYAYVDGEYEIVVRYPGWTVGAASDDVTRFADFRVGVDVRLISESRTPLLGIAFGIPDPSWSSFHVCFVGNAYAGIWRVDGLGRRELVAGATSLPPSGLWDGGARSRLEVVRTGDRVDCILNGLTVVSITTGAAGAPGELGLMVRNPTDSPSARGRFDNYLAAGKWGVVSLTATRTPTPTQTSTPTPTVTRTPTPVFTAIAAQASQAVAYQIDVGHTGATTSSTLNPPLSLLWSVDLGSIASYPLIARGRVYLTARRDSATYATRLTALDTATGRTVWGPVEIDGTDLPANAAYDDGRLFVASFGGLVQAFDAETGQLLWSSQLAELAIHSIPTASQGIVYVTGGGYQRLYALDTKTGDQLWYGAGGHGASPSLSDGAAFVSDSCRVARMNRWSGRLDWSRTFGCASGGGGDTTVYSDGRLFVRGVYGLGDGAILDVRNGDHIGVFAGGYAPAIKDDAIYTVSDGVLIARSIAGQQDLWTFTRDGGLTTAPIVVNEVVYTGSSDGNLYGVDARTGQQVWTASLGTPIFDPSEGAPARPLTGLGAGEGLLVVPAGSMLFAFGPAPAAGATPRPGGD